ncbi:unnamed protein product [Mycena citricolor]|uniref:Uncharacterized protein n=1 Tax=Mycena citricolor TaxID=2018698 RepID=A0AAD2HNC5_9AGAR|nr:unnamed protein product [Mycena citricolor]CAK5278029.1 unnamed protein product [Mycena citricolor]CAK5278780.1 unnamed protein product [Mycena citricolor]
MATDGQITTHGFPPGYFVIRSEANHRLLDVGGHSNADGAPILLWPEKEKFLVENRRRPEADNQVFFIDTSGALCSRASGHAVDIEGDQLVLRHRRPVTYPYPNHYSHPLPRFSYTPSTGEITLQFTHDPSVSAPAHTPTSDWRRKTYILTSLPLRKPRTILDDAHAFIASTITSPISSLFSGGQGASPEVRPEDVYGTDIDLGDNEIVEEERGEEAETDDAAELGREVRVLGIINKEREEKEIVEQARSRRRWQISVIKQIDARTGGI